MCKCFKKSIKSINQFCLIIFKILRYYVKLGLSGLCTLLFLLFSLGLAGIFCNRKQNNYHQSCHRGIASNLLLAAVGLFFIFAITMAVSAAVLSIFGIFGRQLVCKPAIDLNQNEAFQVNFILNYPT